MTRVWISIGSNIDRERHVPSALDDLRARFGDLAVSPVYDAQPVGFASDPFYNLVVGIDTDVPPAALHAAMREIEDAHGRRRGAGGLSPRTLDLDVLTYGDRVTEAGGKHLPRDEIARYAFVLAPLADVAPDERHPELGQTYSALWAAYRGADRDALRRVDGLPWAAPAAPGGADA
jgi:2-amino-4-hydroxy-6-hydroxymethyldihydropteridine diphosphokinase